MHIVEYYSAVTKTETPDKGYSMGELQKHYDKRTRNKESYTVLSNFCEILEKSKPQGQEHTSGFQGLESAERIDCKGYKRTFWSVVKALYLNCDDCYMTVYSESKLIECIHQYYQGVKYYCK